MSSIRRTICSGGGVRGGEVEAQGTPDDVAAVEGGGYTGQYVKPMLERQAGAAR